MLDDLAIAYVNKSEDELGYIAYGLTIIGGVIAAVVNRSKGELHRAPYFALSGLLVFAVFATQTVWLGSLQAMAGGYLWALMAVDVLKSVVFGYFLCVIAMMRSRDAFGHRRYGALAFIPLANLVLLLREPKNEVSANRIPTIPLLTGGLGVLSGFVMLAAGVALLTNVRMQIDKMVERTSSDPSSQAIGVEFLIRSQGLALALAQMADEVATPLKVDEVTTLFDIKTDATTLRYQYTIDADADYLLDSFRQRLIQDMCANDTMRPVYKAGGIVEQSYYRMDGREIGTVRITREQCEF